MGRLNGRIVLSGRDQIDGDAVGVRESPGDMREEVDEVVVMVEFPEECSMSGSRKVR